MPDSNRREVLTKDRLMARVKACTLKIGVARRANDHQTTAALRDRRAVAIRKLAERHNVWSLINAEGRSEFVDYAEWEHRMVAWARRNNVIPPGLTVDAVTARLRQMAHNVNPANPANPAPESGDLGWRQI